MIITYIGGDWFFDVLGYSLDNVFFSPYTNIISIVILLNWLHVVVLCYVLLLYKKIKIQDNGNLQVDNET